MPITVGTSGKIQASHQFYLFESPNSGTENKNSFHAFLYDYYTDINGISACVGGCEEEKDEVLELKFI